MSVTPFIKPIKIQGGTFYTASSASEDLNYTLDSSNYKFRFSNFALLKIPKLKSLRTDYNEDLINNTIHKHNYVQLDSVIGAHAAWYKGMPNIVPNVQNNVALAESFQNYFYNLETILTSADDYSIEEKRTVSERVFFKWLKEIGALRFRQANTNEVVEPTKGYGTRFVEEDESLDINGELIYERVVKYLGNINVINSIKNPKNSFTEVYVHVPVNHGSTKDPLFNSIEDKNYYPGKIIETKNTGLNEEYIEGRKYDDIHPAGLNTLAFYDSKGSFTNCWKFDETLNEFIDSSHENFDWWFNAASSADNSYYLENVFSDVRNDIFAIGYDNTSNPNEPGTTDHTKFIRNKLDGISLEFKPEVYKRIANNNSIDSLGSYNESIYAENFDFNCVLLYYDLYNVDDPNNYTTNLFGVLFLDNVDFISGDGGTIPSLTKYKPNKILSQNGNSYAFRLNIKFDVNAEDSAIEISINDYNTFSLQLYLDALTKMKLMAEKMDEYVNSYKNLNEEVKNLKGLLFDTETLSEINTRITKIEQKITDAEEVFLNNDNIVSLIQKTYNEITNIYKNYTSVEMTYNLDTFKEGNGIELDKSSKEHVKIINKKQGFSVDSNSIVNISEKFNNLPDVYTYYHTLIDYDNYVRITDKNTNPYIIDKNIIFYIDDSITEWKKGQKIRISFENGLNMNNTNGIFNLLIYSDAKDKLMTGLKYTQQIGYISSSNFNENNSFKPIIEIICIDPTNWTFVVDIF